MYSGLHGPNSAWTQADYNVIDLARFTSCKLMHYHTHADIQELRVHGVKHFLVRLQDSVWDRPAGKYISSYFDYGDALIERILYFYQAGVLDYQIDNEPNISWKLIGQINWVYRAFMLDVLDYIRPKLPTDVRLGFPSVSFATEWLPMGWLDPQKDVAERFDFLCLDSYWQSGRTGKANILAGPMTWSQFGGNHLWYAGWMPGMPMQIAEYGNSIQEQGVLTPEKVDALRAEQYPIYLEWLSGFPYIEAAHLYLGPGATQDWAGFRLTPTVAAAIGARAIVV